jgi:glutamyl-tRNA synthetase
VFDTTKLEWMNGQYLSLLRTEELVEPVRRELNRMGIDQPGDLIPLINSVKARSRTILHVAEQVAVRLRPGTTEFDAKGKALVNKMGQETFVRNLKLANSVLTELKEANNWKSEQLLSALTEVAKTNQLKLGDVMQPVRVALTGSTVSEPVNELLVVVGPQKSTDTLTRVATRLSGGSRSA